MYRVTVVIAIIGIVMVLALPMRADTRGGIVINIDLGPVIARLTGRLVTTIAEHAGDECNIYLVGVRYHGQPGQAFEDSGETFETGADGVAEIISTRKARRSTDEPVDQFGFVDRELPMPRVRARR